MYHDLPRGARFWSLLLSIDQGFAEDARKKACPCGGRLHCANYLRKPRGTPVQLSEAQCLRLSFCCDRDGCRKRARKRTGKVILTFLTSGSLNLSAVDS
jgi:hypothetical protein